MGMWHFHSFFPYFLDWGLGSESTSFLCDHGTKGDGANSHPENLIPTCSTSKWKCDWNKPKPKRRSSEKEEATTLLEVTATLPTYGPYSGWSLPDKFRNKDFPSQRALWVSGFPSTKALWEECWLYHWFLSTICIHWYPVVSTDSVIKGVTFGLL